MKGIYKNSQRKQTIFFYYVSLLNFLFPPLQFYYFPFSFLNSVLHNFNIFPQFFILSYTILIFSLTFIIFPPPPHFIIYILLYISIHRCMIKCAYTTMRLTCILGRTYFVERSIHLIDEHWLLIITGVQASGVIIDRLLRQRCFVWSEIVGPHSSGNFNDWPLKLKAGSKI